MTKVVHDDVTSRIGDTATVMEVGGNLTPHTISQSNFHVVLSWRRRLKFSARLTYKKGRDRNVPPLYR
jgi:hypothetical protein